MREAAGMRHARTRLRRRSSGGGCDGRYEKKYGVVGCCDMMKPTLRSHTAVGIAQLALPRSLKMKSDRFEKASEEIGVPRGKKSERYRSTPHYRSSDAQNEKCSHTLGCPVLDDTMSRT